MRLLRTHYSCSQRLRIFDNSLNIISSQIHSDNVFKHILHIFDGIVQLDLKCDISLLLFIYLPYKVR